MGKQKLRSINKLNRKKRLSVAFDYNQADKKLKFIIGVLQGKFVGSSRKGRVPSFSKSLFTQLSIVFSVKSLEKMGKNRRSKKNFLKTKHVECFSYNWADQKLSYIIQILLGKHIVCSRKGRIHLALIAKQLLRDHGFDWHCDRLDNWIHRTQKLEQPIKADLSRELREDSQNKKREIKYLGDLFI